MEINWTAILTIMGGQTALLAVIAWLIKTVINSKLANDAEVFRVQLKADADKELESFRIGLQANTDVEIERLRSALQITAEEQKVRFTRLHEKRGIVIARVYKLIVEAADASLVFVHSGSWEETSKRSEEFHKLEVKFTAIATYFETSRIYLPERVCASLEATLKAIRIPYIKAFTYTLVGQLTNQAQINERNEALQSAVLAFEREIPAAKKALEDEFRNLLGVK
jgi:hypothetical protein